MDHDKKSHKIKQHSIFYINTSKCQNKTSNDVNEHLQSVKHGIMFKFNKHNVETNAIIPLKNNFSNLNYFRSPCSLYLSMKKTVK